MNKDLNVTIDLSAITVSIHANPDNKDEVIEKAKEVFLSEVQRKFPQFHLTVSETDVLSMETVTTGLVVTAVLKNGEKEPGIITAVNKKTIDVVLENGSILNGPATAFEVNSIQNLDEVVWGRPEQVKEANMWYEGNTGYLVTSEDIVPVVLGKSRSPKYRAYVINGEGRYITLNEDQLRFLSDTKEEALAKKS